MKSKILPCLSRFTEWNQSTTFQSHMHDLIGSCPNAQGNARPLISTLPPLPSFSCGSICLMVLNKTPDKGKNEGKLTLCPWNLIGRWLDPVDETTTIPSKLPEMICLPFIWKARALTGRLWALSACTSFGSRLYTKIYVSDKVNLVFTKTDFNSLLMTQKGSRASFVSP